MSPLPSTAPEAVDSARTGLGEAGGRAGRDPLRIALMLRPLDEKGGIAMYARYLTSELIRLDSHNRYFLYYTSEKHVGRFGKRENVTERVLRAPHKLLWDQVAVPIACWRDRVDIVFHPKFTVPLAAPCKTAMVLHGADWLVPEQARFYPRANVWYMRAVLPIYCRRAAVVLSVSRLTTKNVYRALALPAGKVRTVYFGPAAHFRPVADPARLREVRERYRLPKRFILTLTKPLGAERKNLGGILEAYRRFHGSTGHALVVGGQNCEQYRDAYGIPDDGWGGDVVFPGWIDQEDLPAVYSLADFFLYPSNLEAFPIPVTEAMACGTPILTSDANGLREIAGDAAVRVDPDDPEEIGRAMQRLAADEQLRRELASRGLDRVRRFDWTRCARRTLRILESLPPGRGPAAEPAAKPDPGGPRSAVRET